MNKLSSLNIKIENMLQRFICISFLFKSPCNTFHCFGKGVETRAIFLDISKAFEKVCHEGLTYKLRQSDITGNLFLTDFISNRKQRVVLNS